MFRCEYKQCAISYVSTWFSARRTSTSSVSVGLRLSAFSRPTFTAPSMGTRAGSSTWPCVYSSGTVDAAAGLNAGASSAIPALQWEFCSNSLTHFYELSLPSKQQMKQYNILTLPPSARSKQRSSTPIFVANLQVYLQGMHQCSSITRDERACSEHVQNAMYSVGLSLLESLIAWNSFERLQCT